MTDNPKTYKRETAIALLVCLMGLAGASVVYPQGLEVLKTVVYPVMAFAGLAFGMDSYAKQVKG